MAGGATSRLGRVREQDPARRLEVAGAVAVAVAVGVVEKEVVVGWGRARARGQARDVAWNKWPEGVLARLQVLGWV